ncbi:MAG: TetR/AcrR family transcriptional regulator [Proteobacteria bacterium]|nr:TetR/AcrR family transcriptional regulator [Pseudomonadota bacterium]
MARNKETNKIMRSTMKLRLIDAAVDLISEKGYFAVSPKDITSHACVSSGIFYHYFKNKKALVSIFINEIGITLAEHLDRFFTSKGDFEHQCRQGFNALFDFIEPNYKYFKIFIMEYNNLELKSLFDSMLHEKLIPDSNRRLLKQGEDGSVRKDIDRDIMSHVILFASIEAIRLHILDGIEKNKIIDNMVKLLVSGLATQNT